MRAACARALATAGIVAILAPGLASQPVLARWDDGSLDLAGYVRALTALQRSAFDAPGFDRTSGLGGHVTRLKWRARGDGWVLELHNRLQARGLTASNTEGSVVGFGVGAVPGRSVDLETTLVEGEHGRVWHDFDRMALTLYRGGADITIGRQAITWGLSSLFPVADLWARFSPYELDTEEKPGIDAIRVLTYPGSGLELDAVVADRGTLDDLSLGLRATLTFGFGDAVLAAGKFWREAILIVGGSLLLDEVKLRAEAALPWEIDDEDGDGEDGLDAPRATLGADWIRGDVVISGEVHVNGLGASDPADYAALLSTDPRLSRGETYYLGRLYAGALASWRVTDRLSLAGTVLANLEDGSATLTPAASYDLGQNARVSIGGLVSAGTRPEVSGGPTPRVDLTSEFGSYGSLIWSQVSLYF